MELNLFSLKISFWVNIQCNSIHQTRWKFSSFSYISWNVLICVPSSIFLFSISVCFFFVTLGFNLLERKLPLNEGCDMWYLQCSYCAMKILRVHPNLIQNWNPEKNLAAAARSVKVCRQHYELYIYLELTMKQTCIISYTYSMDSIRIIMTLNVIWCVKHNETANYKPSLQLGSLKVTRKWREESYLWK